jgi:hypothetical protein
VVATNTTVHEDVLEAIRGLGVGES